jgi:hypothetical protein
VLRESADRVAEWLKSCFIVPNPTTDGSSKLRASFVAVCSVGAPKKSDGGATDIGGGGATGGGLQVTIYLNAGTGDGGESMSKVRICCNNIDVVSELVQDIVKHFKITELESEADFPAELEEFEQVINEVAECNASRLRLAADMADDSQRIKVTFFFLKQCYFGSICCCQASFLMRNVLLCCFRSASTYSQQPQPQHRRW